MKIIIFFFYFLDQDLNHHLNRVQEIPGPEFQDQNPKDLNQDLFRGPDPVLNQDQNHDQNRNLMMLNENRNLKKRNLLLFHRQQQIQVTEWPKLLILI